VSHGLSPRPELGPEETAALICAATELLRPRDVIEVDEVPVWRFSGRWFNSGPFSLRRPDRLR